MTTTPSDAVGGRKMEEGLTSQPSKSRPSASDPSHAEPSAAIDAHPVFSVNTVASGINYVLFLRSTMTNATCGTD